MIEYKNKLTTSKPDLPDLDEYIGLLRDIWDRKHVTNFGKYHREFEADLANFLHCKNLSLFCNGTIALQLALRALKITGEIITTPFTFSGTTHAIYWNNCDPVFCDIDPDTFCLDPARLLDCITPRTTAILPVHVYGRPCDVDRIQEIADTHGLKVVYDAAHAFGVEMKDGRSLLECGDVSMLSFHATKVFNSVEGGATVTPDRKLKKRIDSLSNFGIVDEVTVVGPGTNGKMNELSAAYGLLVLRDIRDAIAVRGRIDARYRETLRDIPGLKVPALPADSTPNYCYFPVLIEDGFGKSRDALWKWLVERDILARPYFYPLTSNIPTYSHVPSAAAANLPVANDVARRALCLPIFSAMEMEDVDRIASAIGEFQRAP